VTSEGERRAGPAVVVREARPDEYGRIGEITVAAYRGVGETDEGYFPELRDVARRAALVPVLVAVDTGTGLLLGAVTYVPGPGPYFEEGFGEDAAAFRMLAVADDARGRGAGRALVEACIERARRDGRAAIGMHTRPFMLAAQRLYASLGFERLPDADWEFAPGEWLYAYRLTL
jgi:ribosomal protein S18 acetylase RimI-like enzyme